MKKLSGVLPFLLLVSPLGAATFTVDSTGDEPDANTGDDLCHTAGGACTLRAAMQQANATAGADTIAFNIPGSGVHTIAPASELPQITDSLTIDGYTQPGASANTDPVATNAVILIELDGTPNGVGIGLSVQTGATIRGLAIGGFTSKGIHMYNAQPRTVAGCFIGTDPTGSFAHPNFSGIGTVDNTTVGGTSPADRNLISGNTDDGIDPGGTTGVLILGNLVGTDKTGQFAIPNGHGIGLNGFSAATIGGAAPGARNVVSGNATYGIQFNVNTVVLGNFIGTTADGLSPLGNYWDGIWTGGGNNHVGGINPGEGNLIAYNGRFGFVNGAAGNSGVGNVIRGNSIHDNGNIGIDLGANGVTPNDTGDSDTGSNNLQNFPILQSVEHLGPEGSASTRIVGKLDSAASTTYDLDFYGNSVCSNFPREFVEGQTWLGTTQATTDGNGHADFDVTLPVATEVGARITATATDPSGNTSEFSQRIVFSMLPASGPPAGGAALAIKGTDFAPGMTATIGGVNAGASFTDSTTLSATSPALSPGTSNDVVVTTPDGTVGTLIKGWVADFLDVPSGQQFYAFVTTLVSNGITAGVGGGLYGVNQGTKRQQMAVFLLKSKYGLCYVPPQCMGVFPDVPCPSTFADWIEALAAEGITTGCGGGLFCPDNLVTRRQMAVFLLKTKHGSNYAPPACTGVFDDVPCPGAPAVDFIERLAAEQITGGCSASPPLYCPDSSSTRGQMAVFITKTFNLQ